MWGGFRSGVGDVPATPGTRPTPVSYRGGHAAITPTASFALASESTFSQRYTEVVDPSRVGVPPRWRTLCAMGGSVSLRMCDARLVVTVTWGRESLTGGPAREADIKERQQSVLVTVSVT